MVIHLENIIDLKRLRDIYIHACSLVYLKSQRYSFIEVSLHISSLEPTTTKLQQIYSLSVVILLQLDNNLLYI